MTGQDKPKVKRIQPRSATAEDYKKQSGWQVGTVYTAEQLLKEDRLKKAGEARPSKAP